LGIPWGFRLARSFAAGFNSTQVIEETARAPEDGMKLIARAVIRERGRSRSSRRAGACVASSLFRLDAGLGEGMLLEVLDGRWIGLHCGPWH